MLLALAFAVSGLRARPPTTRRVDPARCAVVAAVLTDLPHIDGSGADGGKFIAASAPALVACPDLLSSLPNGLQLADDEAIKNASTAFARRPATVFSIGLPQVEGRRGRATVALSYRCSGLCGAEFVLSYARVGKGWVLQGKRVLSVS